MSREREILRRSAESITDPAAGTIVLLDQEPLRATVAGDCASVLARLDCARSGWHHFERKDKPAFARWRAREFGALLSTAREVEERIRDAETIVHEVEMEMLRIFQDASSAYQRVMFRRAHPAGTAEKEAEFSRDGRTTEGKVSEFEKEALFQEWVKSSLGTNPDKMDDEVYSTTFETFKSHMFRGSKEEVPLRHSERPGKAPPGRPREAATSSEPTEEEAAPVDVRVRELYRRLVRRLHPDLRADGSTAVSALWHEVQEAYAANDVARMEILLAVSDIETNRMAGQTLAQLHAVRAELRRALRALEKSLLEAEGEDAWDFARIGPNASLRVQVERQLQSDLATRTQRLDLLTRTIAEWARGPVANRKVQLSSRGTCRPDSPRRG